MTSQWARSVIFQTVGVPLLTLTSISCSSFDGNHREVIARNAQWTVTAVGDLQSTGKAFGTNLVRFEVSRSGSVAPYADGNLYEAGPHDHSFALRYELREWVSPNVLRLSHIPPPKLPIVNMLVRNESAATIKWLRIDTDELVLFFQLQPAESAKVPAGRWGDSTNITVRGVFDTGRSFEGRKRGLVNTAEEVGVFIGESGVHIGEPR